MPRSRTPSSTWRYETVDDCFVAVNDYPINVVLPAELIEKIAGVAAKLVIEQLEAEHGLYDKNYLLTVAEAANAFRCKPQRIYNLVSSQRLPKFKDGTRTLLRRADLDLHIAS